MQKYWILLTALSFSFTAFAQRLPEGVTPKHYQLMFAPDFTTEKFAGETTIDIELSKPTNVVTVNAAEIEFHSVEITAAGRTQKATVKLRDADEMADLSVKNPIPAGPAKIAIRYTGLLNPKLRGLYLSKANGRKYAVSQMEATDARRAFPSFDEPAYKATFDISAVVDKNDTAFSNEKLVSDTPEGGNRHRLKFATTPKMSTYLVALVVGDWKCSEGEQDGVPLRVCAIPGREQLTKFGLEATKQSIKYFNQYYGIKYPYGKLDQVAVPDFEAGAMENTGLITYRETYLLADEKNTTLEKKKFIAEVIAHEIAHQWFGDLVTMKWWDDIWLNEGFASWMEMKPIEAWHPNWQIPIDQANASTRAMATDSLANTRPIQQQAETRGEINGLFDSIAYEKTAAVLRMIESYVGEEAFRKGINAYLSKYAYGNASATDFWTTMTEATGKPIDRVLSSFVKQPGMPYVSIRATCENGKTQLAFEQKRFFYDRQKFQSGNNQVWQVPVCLKTGNGKLHCELLTQAQQTATIDGCMDLKSANADAAGFYRFDNPQVTQQSSVDAMSEAERLSLLDNEWALVRPGVRSVDHYLALAETLRQDRNPAIVSELAGRFQYIHRYLVTEDNKPNFEQWVRNALTPVLNDLGMAPRPGDTAETNELRATVFRSLALDGKDPKLVAEANRLTDEYLNDEGSVESSLAEAAVAVAAANGDRGLYDRLLAQLRRTKSVDQYYTLFYALADFRSRDLLARTLDWVLTPDVRNQDIGLIGSVMANPVGGELAWNFIQNRAAEIQKKASSYDFGGITAGMSTFCDAKLLNDVNEYFRDNPGAETRRSRQGVETIRYCIDMKQQQAPRLANWLQTQGSRGAAK